MSNQSFCFKQFSVKQDKCAMKVGTDAVLLGAWASVEGSHKILDIGTGTGVIALMLAQKSTASIDALDIDEDSCQQARENIRNSKWKDRIFVHHTPFQNYSSTKDDKYCVIISNPPFFVGSYKSPDNATNTAHHADLLPFQELLNGVLSLLHPEGKFCVILPLKEGEQFIQMAAEKKLFLTKLTRVRTTGYKSTEKGLLMQFEFNKKQLAEDVLTIESDTRHSYTEEYKQLTKDYYPAF